MMNTSSNQLLVDPKEGVMDDNNEDFVQDLQMMKDTAPTELSLAERLDENFFFLFNFISKDVNAIEDEKQRNITRGWLERLSTISTGVEEGPKLMRAVYMNKLIESIMEKKFQIPFDRPVNETGALPKLSDHYDTDLKYYDENEEGDYPEWLENLMENSSKRDYIGGRLYESYLSTKFFDNERGSCAYLAVSAYNEGDKSAWYSIKLNERREKKLAKFYDREMKYLEEAMNDDLMENNLLGFDDWN
jgi:hypothetical protein